MTLIRIFSVGFNGNNTTNHFINNGFQVSKQKLAIAIT
jgi:cell division GTPase FtsZ